MNHLNQEQTAYLINNLFYALEVNNVPKQRNVATAIEIVDLGNKLLSVIGIEEDSDLYENAVRIMDQVHVKWAE